MTAPRYFNDGSAAPPQLRVYLNLENLSGLRADSVWPGLEGAGRDQRLRADGFEGVQLTTDATPSPGASLPFCGLDRISAPSEADAVAARHARRGDQCITVHVGWGTEDDAEVFRLVDAVLTASEKHALPIFIETHRATITQDMWRTVKITEAFPQVLFNGDFSHYYCGQEMVYGDFARKLAFLEPVLARTAFLHGRIASPGSMQVPIGPDVHSRPTQAHGVENYLDHFKEIWTRAMLGFLRNAGAGDVLIFAPELLPGTYYYARLFPDSSGRLVEESDRYAQALLYKDLARACFTEAQRRAKATDQPR